MNFFYSEWEVDKSRYRSKVIYPFGAPGLGGNFAPGHLGSFHLPVIRFTMNRPISIMIWENAIVINHINESNAVSLKRSCISSARKQIDTPLAGI